MKLDPTTGRSRDPRYVDDFDGVEVVTFGIPSETTPAMKDWFGLLRHGRHYTATGNSDSHTITLRPAGWPRTYVCVDNDDPPFLDVPAFTAALRAGCATISAGPFVTITSGGVKMGGLRQAKDGAFDLEIEVRAASWIPTDRLRLFVDGVPQQPIPLKETKKTLRYRGTQKVRCTRDCFVVAYVDSDTSLAPLITQRRKLDPKPVALTNPIYVDVDGNGTFDAVDAP